MLVHSLILFLLTWSITGLLITVFAAQEIKPAGQITIAGKTYEFEVELCHKMDTGELSAFTLGGSAQTSDGGIVSVNLSAVDKKESTEHTVVVMTMEGQYFAHAKNDGSGWKNDQGEPAEPLVSVSGKNVSVTGAFSFLKTGGMEPKPVGIGTIKATCNQVMSTQTQ